MANHPPLTLALVLLLASPLALAVPMGPSMGFLGPSLLWPGAGYGGHKMGMSFNCGANFGACVNKQERYDMVYVPSPTSLAASDVRIADDDAEHMTAIIEDSSASTSDNHGQGYGPFGYGQNLGYGGGHGGLGGYGGGLGSYGGGLGGYGGGHGGLGGYGGGMGYGLMGALGGFGPLGGVVQDHRLDLVLEVVLSSQTPPTKVLVVFTEFAVPHSCLPEYVGHVITGPENSQASQGGYGGGGYGGWGYGGWGYGGWGYASPYMMLGGGPYGGQPGDSLALEREFGVIAQLSLKMGTNTFTIKNLPGFTSFSQLAGRGIALCEDVVMGAAGKPMCTGSTFQIMFCGQLAYSNQGSGSMGPIYPYPPP